MESIHFFQETFKTDFRWNEIKSGPPAYLNFALVILPPYKIGLNKPPSIIKILLTLL